MHLYRIAIISGLKDGHTLTQYPEKIVILYLVLRNVVPLHFSIIFKALSIPCKDARGRKWCFICAHVILQQSLVDCVTPAPTYQPWQDTLTHPHHPIRNRGGYRGGQQ